MSEKKFRILLIADTHLGFDLPLRPRIVRRRRGHDFFANFERALIPAHNGDVDLVVHGGDLFYRSRVPEALVDMAMTPLVQVAEKGIPVYIVPGNHERARIPLHLWSAHPNLHIFDEPKTYLLEKNGARLALVGFPFSRTPREAFGKMIQLTAYRKVQCDIRLLCMHQTVEGAQVGPSDYTFRSGPDVIPGVAIPGEFAAILSGHIHRAQMLTHDLKGVALKTPVIYPGSVERTSFAERKEGKKYVLLEVEAEGSSGGKIAHANFIPLPARPMLTLVLASDMGSIEEVNHYLKVKLKEIDPNAIVRIRLQEPVLEELSHLITAEHLRSLAPESMNVSVALPRPSGLKR